MTARTNTTPRRRSSKKVVEEPTIDVNLDDLSTDVIVDDVPEVSDEPAPVASNRKYFSHANCDHARKGEAGKAARAQCRRNIRAWLAAEAEFLSNDDAVAV